MIIWTVEKCIHEMSDDLLSFLNTNKHANNKQMTTIQKLKITPKTSVIELITKTKLENASAEMTSNTEKTLTKSASSTISCKKRVLLFLLTEKAHP